MRKDTGSLKFLEWNSTWVWRIITITIHLKWTCQRAMRMSGRKEWRGESLEREREVRKERLMMKTLRAPGIIIIIIIMNSSLSLVTDQTVTITSMVTVKKEWKWRAGRCKWRGGDSRIMIILKHEKLTHSWNKTSHLSLSSFFVFPPFNSLSS